VTEPQPRLSPTGRFLSSAPSAALPLSSVIWADGATLVPLADQNGAIVTPFADAATAFGVLANGDVLNLVPMGGTSYGNLTVNKSVCIQSASFALEQLGTNAIAVRPTATQLGALTVASNTVLACTGLAIASLSLDADGTANALLSQCDMGSVSSLAGGFVQMWDCQAAAECDFFSLVCAQTTFGTLVQASAIVANDSNFAGIQAGAGSAALTLIDCTARAIVCGPSTFEDCSIVSIDSNDDCTISDTSVSGAVHVAGILIASDSRFGSGLTVDSQCNVTNCQVSGGLTAGADLLIDEASYDFALAHGGVTVTGAISITSTPPLLTSTVDTTASPITQVLAAAGHPPGLYCVGGSCAVTTAAAHTLTPTVHGSGDGGAFAIGNDPAWTPIDMSALKTVGLAPLAVYSDGTVALSLVWTLDSTGGDVGNMTLRGGARLIAQG
jgi:hypothetical protein